MELEEGIDLGFPAVESVVTAVLMSWSVTANKAGSLKKEKIAPWNCSAFVHNYTDL